MPVQDRAKNSYCYNCLIETHQTQAHNLAGRILGDWAAAEDVVQEAFISGYRAFGGFRGDNVRAWLLRTVANAAKDAIRSRAARPAISLDFSPLDPEDSSAPSSIDVPSKDDSSEEHAVRMELGRAIQEGLSSLSEERRLAVNLVDVQGFSYEETAQIMNCSLGTVKSRVARGRADMRDFLRGRRELLPDKFRHD